MLSFPVNCLVRKKKASVVLSKFVCNYVSVRVWFYKHEKLKLLILVFVDRDVSTLF